MLWSNTIFNEDIFKFLRDDFFFNSSVRDMNPTAYYKKGTDYIIEAKTLGIDGNDITVTLDNNIITISGETQNEYGGKSFNANLRVKLEKEIIDGIDTIDYMSKNGITYVFIHMKEVDTSGIQINKI